MSATGMEMSKDDHSEAIWEAAEEHVRDRIARGGPCVSRIHHENMVEEKYQELLSELLEGTE
jgi:type II secretory pathway component PulF